MSVVVVVVGKMIWRREREMIIIVGDSDDELTCAQVIHHDGVYGCVVKMFRENGDDKKTKDYDQFRTNDKHKMKIIKIVHQSID